MIENQNLLRSGMGFQVKFLSLEAKQKKPIFRIKCW